MPDRVAALAVAVAVALVAAVPTAAAAAPVPLPVLATLPGGDGRSLLVVDLTAASATDQRTVTVTQDGAPVTATLSPVVSSAMGVTLVVDASAAGAQRLPAWLSAGARFILETPAEAQAVVVTDSAPAAVALPAMRGRAEVVRALGAVRPAGPRDTPAALSLAAEQFPDVGPGHKLVVLYTSAPDAGGESAADLAARYRERGQLLVVVGPATTWQFWGPAAAATGGFFAPAGDPVVVPALDQVRTTLRSRYLVEIPTPRRLPATLTVGVDAGGLDMIGQAVVTAPPAESPDDDPAVPAAVGWALAALGVSALVTIALILLRRRRSPGARIAAPATAPGDGRGPAAVPDEPRRIDAVAGRAPPAVTPSAFTGEPRPAPEVARGRASIPASGEVARGRASPPFPGRVARGRAAVPLFHADPAAPENPAPGRAKPDDEAGSR